MQHRILDVRRPRRSVPERPALLTSVLPATAVLRILQKMRNGQRTSIFRCARRAACGAGKTRSSEPSSTASSRQAAVRPLFVYMWAFANSRKTARCVCACNARRCRISRAAGLNKSMCVTKKHLA